jgi:predicted nucleotidyltransferase component of viral defense system
MTRKIVNLSASVHSRLLNKANSEGQGFIDFLMLFANERFLYRLSQTAHAEKFVLKGAMAILNLGMAHPRYTRDIDFSGYLELNIRDIEKIMREICEMPVVDDGLIFDTTSITCDPIKAHDQYPGVRVRL